MRKRHFLVVKGPIDPEDRDAPYLRKKKDEEKDKQRTFTIKGSSK
jgi:hypothetical protein